MNELEEKVRNEYVDYKGIGLPIGVAKAEGPIEDFKITIYDRHGAVFRFRATGGNLCECKYGYEDDNLIYEVK